MMYLNLFIFVICLNAVASTDVPCAARSMNNSVVCVCNATYCDTITRLTVVSGQYAAYVTSKDGLRYNKTTGDLLSTDNETVWDTHLKLNTSKTYQTIIGFGGAVTDSAAINWKNLNDSVLMQNLIESYCGASGNEYNVLRNPIGASDFSSRAYTLNDLPINDTELSNFTLAIEDTDYKIPMINACIAASSTNISMFGSPWSPPTWMKTNNDYNGTSQLIEDFISTYSQYLMKWIIAYKAEGIDTWGLSISNEASAATIGDFGYLISLGWTFETMGAVYTELCELRSNSTENSYFKILAVDDNRYTTPWLFNRLLKKFPALSDCIDGVGVHGYWNNITPPQTLTQPMVSYPSKFVMSTELCTGGRAWGERGPNLGSWDRAVFYADDILENLNYNVTGWLDWNLCLDLNGGPSWADSKVDAPIIVNVTAAEFYKQPMFYALGHFSKFIPRDSQRIDVNMTGTTNVPNVAFLTPRNTVVVVMHNKSTESVTVSICLDDRQVLITLVASSITTVELLST